MEHLDQLPGELQPELIQASESGRYYQYDIRRCDFLSNMLKPFDSLSRTVQIISCTCLRMQALKVERWRLLMMMSPVCGLMVSRTVWPVLRLSMERKLLLFFFIVGVVDHACLYYVTIFTVQEMLYTTFSLALKVGGIHVSRLQRAPVCV